MERSTVPMGVVALGLVQVEVEDVLGAVWAKMVKQVTEATSLMEHPGPVEMAMLRNHVWGAGFVTRDRLLNRVWN